MLFRSWVINIWLINHPQKWNLIKAVVLYGDPCYHSGISRGLVRRSDLRGTCMPKSSYPLPSASASFGAQSYTEPQDPVTGDGWGFDPAAAQLTAAVRCVANHCTHLDYATSTTGVFPLIKAGASFVVRRLT